MLRKGNMTKIGEEDSGKGWEQRLDFVERMGVSPKAAHSTCNLHCSLSARFS